MTGGSGHAKTPGTGARFPPWASGRGEQPAVGVDADHGPRRVGETAQPPVPVSGPAERVQGVVEVSVGARMLERPRRGFAPAPYALAPEPLQMGWVGAAAQPTPHRGFGASHDRGDPSEPVPAGLVHQRGAGGPTGSRSRPAHSLTTPSSGWPTVTSRTAPASTIASCWISTWFRR